MWYLRRKDVRSRLGVPKYIPAIVRKADFFPEAPLTRMGDEGLILNRIHN